MSDNLTISTGSGTTIATDQIGTEHYQKVKLVVGASDTANLVVFGETAMTASLPVVVANDQSTISVSVVAFTPGGTQNVAVISPIYSVGATSMAATGTGIMMIGVQSGATTGRALALTVSGNAYCQVSTGTLTVSAGNIAISNTPTVTASQGGTWNVATITTLLGTIAISGTATALPSGTQDANITNPTQQYPTASTGLGSTGTGMLVLGVIGTTARALGVNTTGGLTYLDNVGNITTGTLSISAGNIAISNTPTITVSTVLSLSVVGTVSTVSTVLALPVISASNVSIASITAGTLNLLSVVSTVSTVSTVLAMPVLSATNVTVASITTGTVSVVNVISATGVLLAATTAIIGAVVQTAHASGWNAYVVTTTATATILKTSGAHTLYVTDLLFSVDVPMNIEIRSATTAVAGVYLATKGGFVFPTRTPVVLNSAQSLTFLPSASGSCAGFAGGWTVT